MSPFASLLAIPFPAIDPIALQIGPIAIRWYGLAYVAGLLLGWLYLKRLVATPRLWRDEKSPFQPVLTDDLFLWVAVGVIVGGRLGHVLLYEPGFYLSNPLQILYVWQGGMAFHGGMLGTILAMWLFARRHDIPALSVMDVVSAAVPIGLFFGRIANFINAEIVGSETRGMSAVTIPNHWGMSFGALPISEAKGRMKQRIRTRRESFPHSAPALSTIQSCSQGSLPYQITMYWDQKR
jgi:phosphatidylglycerol:prolipoprotein diacylglycerol transferase